MKISHLLLLFVLLVAHSPFLFAQNAEDNSWMGWNNGIGRTRWLMYHLEKDDVQLLKQKWEEVGNSIKKSSGKYAGTYLVPAYMSGYFLRWSDEGYVFASFFDVEHPCYFSYGDVEIDGANIKFIKKGENKSRVCPSSLSKQSEEWVIAYDGRFFIPKKDLRSFIDYQGGFGEFNGILSQLDDHIPLAIRVPISDHSAPKEILPNEYKALIKEPIIGEIAAVGKTSIRASKSNMRSSSAKESVTEVSISVGRSHGLKTGQSFVLLTEDNSSYETLIVRSVGKRSSKAIVVRYLSEDGKEEFPSWNDETGSSISVTFTKLRPGIKITTSPHPKVLRSTNR